MVDGVYQKYPTFHWRFHFLNPGKNVNVPKNWWYIHFPSTIVVVFQPIWDAINNKNKKKNWKQQIDVYIFECVRFDFFVGRIKVTFGLPKIFSPRFCSCFYFCTCVCVLSRCITDFFSFLFRNKNLFSSKLPIPLFILSVCGGEKKMFCSLEIPFLPGYYASSIFQTY